MGELTDLFQFIADWMARDANADFDGSGGPPTLGDLLGYIAGWMGGCDF